MANPNLGIAGQKFLTAGPEPTEVQTGAIFGFKGPGLSPNLYLLLASFLSLFVELLLIRWVPSQVRVIAYYGNIMLLSSFLGLGCGAILAQRCLRLTRLFAPLLFVLIVTVAALKGIQFKQGPDEFRFLFAAGTSSTTLPIVSIFALNTLLFLPLGELIGGYFSKVTPLRAYAWDISGAIAGTLLFGLFSFSWFSPVLGFAFAMVGFLVFCANGRELIWNVLFFAFTIIILTYYLPTHGIWSPYNLISVREMGTSGALKPVSTPRENIATRSDPPFYMVQVNGDFYMMNGTIDLRRYTNKAKVSELNEQYLLPYKLRPSPKDVLVVGSGGGVDVEAALLAGADRIDALEIDPVIIQLGRSFNASQSYNDPRVTIANTDARPFFRRTDKTYDVIVFGFLDSQSLFSQMSSIRLDGYVYTQESFQEAFQLLRPGGLLSVSFFSGGHLWMLDRLITMVRSATGSLPMVFIKPTGQVVILAPKGYLPAQITGLRSYRQIARTPHEVEAALDDWPYLYLRSRSIPVDYLFTIGSLLLLSSIFVFTSLARNTRALDLNFLFLGAAFLLLETKSITTVALFFGTTWLVSMVVILGVLIMVLIANAVASMFPGSSAWLYVPLVGSVCLLYYVSPSTVLSWPAYARLVYCLIFVPLPIFFAGLIFSLDFRTHENPGMAFGSNLVGAMVGGFVEYAGMMTGTKMLLLFIIALYLGSFLVRQRLVASS